MYVLYPNPGFTRMYKYKYNTEYLYKSPKNFQIMIWWLFFGGSLWRRPAGKGNCIPQRFCNFHYILAYAPSNSNTSAPAYTFYLIPPDPTLLLPFHLAAAISLRCRQTLKLFNWRFNAFFEICINEFFPSACVYLKKFSLRFVQIKNFFGSCPLFFSFISFSFASSKFFLFIIIIIIINFISSSFPFFFFRHFIFYFLQGFFHFLIFDRTNQLRQSI